MRTKRISSAVVTAASPDEFEDAPLLSLPEEEQRISGEGVTNSNGINHGGGDDDDGDGNGKPLLSSARRWQARSPRTIVLLLSLVKFSIVCSGMLLMVPVYRLIEDAICHAELGDDSPGLIDEMRCKTDAVQSRLVYLLGWTGLLNSVVTLLVAYPYGILADSLGRKPVAVGAYAGLAISFSFAPLMFTVGAQSIRRNPYLLMLGSLSLIAGGGVQVVIATLYAMAADVSAEKDKATSFLYLTFGATAGGLLGPLLAGGLMERFGPWVPIYVVIIITPFLFSIFIFLPETLPARNSKAASSSSPSTTTVRHGLSFKSRVAHGLRDLASSLSMLRDVNVPLILITFLFQSARFHAYTSVLTQYLSKHFGWRLAEVSILLSPLGLLNLCVLAVLPGLSRVLTSPLSSSRLRWKFLGRRRTAFEKDLLLTRVSTVLLILGALVETLGRGSGMFIFGLFISTFGAADSPLARATVSHYVEPAYTSRLYALIGMAEVLGSFIGPPVLAWCFDQGLKLKGVWTGLPWLYIAVQCSVALLALAFVRPPPKRAESGDDDGHLGEEEVDRVLGGGLAP